MIYIVGFLAQLLFSARLLLQWIMSEKAKSRFAFHILETQPFGCLSAVHLRMVAG